MSNRKPRRDERVFKVQSLQRSYTYQVFVTKRGGLVRCITAGCRYWQSFAEAFAHYRGESWRLAPVAKPEWNDAQVLSLAATNFVAAARLYANREDARGALRALERMVQKYQNRRWRARRRARSK
jgi:hypothetical protein